LPAMANTNHRAGDQAVCSRLLEIGIETFQNIILPI
jgi:hypothetical protein